LHGLTTGPDGNRNRERLVLCPDVCGDVTGVSADAILASAEGSDDDFDDDDNDQDDDGGGEADGSRRRGRRR
jgi:hypothetical protein